MSWRRHCTSCSKFLDGGRVCCPVFLKAAAASSRRPWSMASEAPTMSGLLIQPSSLSIASLACCSRPERRTTFAHRAFRTENRPHAPSELQERTGHAQIRKTTPQPTEPISGHLEFEGIEKQKRGHFNFQFREANKKSTRRYAAQ